MPGPDEALAVEGEPGQIESVDQVQEADAELVIENATTDGEVVEVDPAAVEGETTPVEVIEEAEVVEVEAAT